MKQFIIYSIFTTFIYSCGAEKATDKEEPAVKLDTTKNIVSTNDLNGCYMMTIAKDTAMLQLDANGIFVKGKLDYNRFDKDSNKGVFEGTIHDNVMQLWYKFSSEGTVSVREVYLRFKDGILAEGYGDMEMKGDTAVFKFPSTVNYEEQHPYIKVDCASF